MQKEMAIIGYNRLSKYVYRASWSTAQVEHFIYFGTDSRQYFITEFGLRNPEAEKFGIEAVVKYGHPNFRLWQRERDVATECSMRFNFAIFGNASHESWPRVRVPTLSGHDLAVLAVDFARKSVLPIIEIITDLEAYLAFLLMDRVPNQWLTTPNLMIRAAQIVAVSAQLSRSNSEIRELLRPY